MKCNFRNFTASSFLFFIFITLHCNAKTSIKDVYPNYHIALVRNLSTSFNDSLKLNPPPIPIDLNLAKQQHENYIDLLAQLVPEIIRLDADENHPDCNFIEDTAIIVEDIAVISRMGAVERRGEEVCVEKALSKLGLSRIIHLNDPGTMDGGDILYTGKHLFVGISRRTNESALNQLKDIFQERIEVIGVPVVEGLHLKSVISLFDSDTLVVADSFAGKEIKKNIQYSTKYYYKFVSVPDPIASNVLRIGTSLIIQDGYPESEKVLQNLCDQKQVVLFKLNMSELIKADGALTCGSLLIQ